VELTRGQVEDSLSVNPFEGVDTFPVTFGDFVTLYENHLG
jgi:hypothetical protein